MRFKDLKIPLIAGLLLLAAWPACAQESAVSEYQIKAAFLYNFAKFVEWPESPASAPSDHFVLGILGDDPFGAQIQAIEGKPVKNKTLVIVRSATLEELKNCDAIFISASVRKDLGRILKKLNGQPVLTVADTPGMAQAGIMINLYTDDNKVRFEINPLAAEGANLKISSQLLKLARIVANEVE